MIMGKYFKPLRRKIGVVTLVVACVCALSLSWLNWQARTPNVDAATAELLQLKADDWWQNGRRTVSIPKKDWTDALRRLNPQTVTVNQEGVYVQFGSLIVESWGLFILPKGSAFQPKSGTDPSFQLIHDRVFKFEIKG